MKYSLVLALGFLVMGVQAQTFNRTAIFRTGQQFEMQGSKHTLTIYTMEGQDKEFVLGMDLFFHVNVVKAVGTSAVLDITLTRRLIRMKIMEQEHNLDSDSAHHGRNTAIGKALMEGIGKKDQLVVGRSGNVVASSDSMITRNDLSHLDNTERRPGYRFELVAPLPDRPIRKGDQWTDTMKSEINNSTINFRLTSIEKGIGMVEHSGNTTNVGKTISNGMEAYMNTAGTSTGSYTFDIKTGILKTSSITVETSGTTTMRGQDIPIKTKTVSSIVVKPVKN